MTSSEPVTDCDSRCTKSNLVVAGGLVGGIGGGTAGIAAGGNKEMEVSSDVDFNLFQRSCCWKPGRPAG